MSAQAWFKHAVFYEIDTRSFQDSNGDGTGDLKGITERLDYIRSLGVDAILLARLTPAAGGQPNTIDPALGTLDDLDDLALKASRIKIRVLLDLPDPDPALARFWLSRGVAGFHIPAKNLTGHSNSAGIQAIRRLLPGYVGQRVLITDADTPAASADSANPAKRGGNELILDTALLKLQAQSSPAANLAAIPQSAPSHEIAGQIRAALEEARTLAGPESLLMATDAPGVPRSLNRYAASSATPVHDEDLGRITATILMLGRSGVLLSAGQELALSSLSGEGVAMPWGAPPASPEPLAVEQPTVAKSPAPARPAVSDAYVPYVPPKPAAKPIATPSPDPASVAGQQLDLKSPLNFYRQLNQLRRGGTALSDGEETYLNFDALNALVWIRKPHSPSYANPPVVVLCNLSDKPLAIDLKPELVRLHLRGSFLKTLLRSDGGMGAMDLSPVRIPPYGVYVGELKF